MFEPTRCKNCGEPVIKYPIKAEPDKSIGENIKNKTIIWKNLFKVDGMSALFFICIILVIWGFKHDTAKCEAAINDPCGFCNYTGCCRLNEVYIPTEDDLEHGGVFNLSKLADNINNKWGD
jgi:hypothetical protein